LSVAVQSGWIIGGIRSQQTTHAFLLACCLHRLAPEMFLSCSLPQPKARKVAARNFEWNGHVIRADKPVNHLLPYSLIYSFHSVLRHPGDLSFID
jgi:hypothetical protein